MARPPDTQVIDNHNKKYTYPFALFMGIGVVKRLLPKGPKRLENLLCHFVFCLRACLPSPIYETVRLLRQDSSLRKYQPMTQSCHLNINSSL